MTYLEYTINLCHRLLGGLRFLADVPHYPCVAGWALPGQEAHTELFKEGGETHIHIYEPVDFTAAVESGAIKVRQLGLTSWSYDGVNEAEVQGPHTPMFTGALSFLSNFYPCHIRLEGRTFPTVEHAYQWCKNILREEDPSWTASIQKASAAEAKRLGRSCKLWPDWEVRKVKGMLYLLRQKFDRGAVLGKRLIETGTLELVETNYWHDNYWGVCKCQRCVQKPGANTLGKMLMQVRGEISKPTGGS